MRSNTAVAGRWNAVLMFAVILALVTAWMVLTDRAGASSAPATTVAQSEDVLNALLALQDNGSEGGRIFANYDGVDGESVDDNHSKWIDIDAYEWGAHAAAAGVSGSRRRGAAEVEGFVLSFDYEKASPKLEEKLLKGEVIPKLEVALAAPFDGSNATYLRYEMKNVLITDFDVVAKESGGRPHVTFVNNFEEIKVTYTEYADDGSVKGSVEYSYEVGG